MFHGLIKLKNYFVIVILGHYSHSIINNRVSIMVIIIVIIVIIVGCFIRKILIIINIPKFQYLCYAFAISQVKGAIMKRDLPTTNER